VAQRKPFYSKMSPSQQSLLALALFIAATLMSRELIVSPLEENTFLFIYNLPDWLNPLFFFITQFGSIYVLFVLIGIYALKKHYHIVIRLLLVGTLAFLLAGFAKSLVGRERPTELLSNIIALDIFHGSGFPSGHVALAVALAFTIGHVLPRRYHWVPAVWIIGVALSRICLGVHLPLDIVGGFAIGWFSYAIFRHVRIYDVARR
jgi:membrane-associated phospholipid phosphatase